MRPNALSAIGSGASLLAGIAVPIAFPHVDPWIGKALLIAAFGLAVIAFGLWLPRRQDDEAEGVSQSTTGTGAHNFSHVQTVNIHAPSAAPQPPKSPYGGWDARSLEGLERIMRTSGQSQMEHQTLPTLKALEPDMPLSGVLVRVYSALGGAPMNDLEKPAFYRKVDLEIQDKIVERGLHVWGRFGRRAREQLREASLKQGWLDHKRRTFFAPSMDSSPMEFQDLCFNKSEVDRCWPEPLKTTNNGKP